MVNEKDKNIQRSVYLSPEERTYLLSNGFPIAEFFRQGIKAHKEGKWAFDRLKNKQL